MHFRGRGLVKAIEAWPQQHVTQPRVAPLTGAQRPSFGSSFGTFDRFLALIALRQGSPRLFHGQTAAVHGCSGCSGSGSGSGRSGPTCRHHTREETNW